MMDLGTTSYSVGMSAPTMYLVHLANQQHDQDILPGVNPQHKTIQGEADNHSQLRGNKKVVQRQKPIITPTSPA